jgi:RNA polymerase sigma-70 factor (ECF subfamily)
LDAVACRCESPYERLARVQGTESMHAFVASLPASYREVVILREVEELSTLEIAARLHCSVPAVKSRLFRARSMLLATVQKSRGTSNKARVQ